MHQKHSPPYNLAQNLYNLDDYVASDYITEQGNNGISTPLLDALKKNEKHNVKYNNVKDTKHLFDVSTDYYNDLLFIPNHNQPDQDYINQANENYDYLDDFELHNPLDYTVDDQGNIQLVENISIYNTSPATVTGSKNTKEAHVLTDEANDSSLNGLITPFVHPDHYQYLNSEPNREKKILPINSMKQNFIFGPNKQRLKLNLGWDFNVKLPSKVTYDTGNWTPMSVYPWQGIGPNRPRSRPFKTKRNKSKPIRFPTNSRSMFRNVPLQYIPNHQSPYKRLDTIQPINLKKNYTYNNYNQHRFEPDHNISNNEIRSKHVFGSQLHKNLFQTEFDQLHPQGIDLKVPAVFITKSLPAKGSAKRVLLEERKTGESENARCYRRTCTQLVTGRNIDYGRILRIIQTEKYLDFADLSIIRYKRRRSDLYTQRGVTINKLLSNFLNSYGSVKKLQRRLKNNPIEYYQNMLSSKFSVGKSLRIKRFSKYKGECKDGCELKSKQDDGCGGLLTEPGDIVSPNYPNSYNSSATGGLIHTSCEWTIRFPLGQRIVLNFKEFHLGEHLPNNTDCR